MPVPLTGCSASSHLPGMVFLRGALMSHSSGECFEAKGQLACGHYAGGVALLA
jgi:hypothetical protein